MDIPQQIEDYVKLRLRSDTLYQASAAWLLSLFLRPDDQEAAAMWSWLDQARQQAAAQAGQAAAAGAQGTGRG